MGCVAAASIRIFSGILLDQVSDSVGVTARQAAERLQTYFDNMSETVSTVYSKTEVARSIRTYYDEDGRVRYDSYQSLNRFISELLRANDTIDDILILSDGLCLNYNQSSSSSPVRPDAPLLRDIRRDIAQADAFRVSFRAAAYGAFHYRQSDSLMLLLAFPVTDLSTGASDRVATMIFVTDFSRLGALYQAPDLYPNSTAFLLDGQGRALACTAETDYPLDTLPDGVQRVSVAGRGMLSAVAEVKSVGWRVGYLVDLAFLTARVRAVQLTAVSFILLALLCAVCAAVYIGWRATQPVTALTRSMERLAQGDFSVRMEQNARFRELSVLSTGFNDMAEQITSLIHEVYDVRLLQNEAELTALHSKLDPHFFYNALQIIQSLAILGDTERLQDVVPALGRLFEYVLYNDSSIVPLAAEETHIRSYLEIQRARFTAPLRFVCRITPEAAACPIPKLIIQPLVENCVKHGLDPAAPRPCIGLYADCRGGVLRIRVADNGCGIPANRLSELRAGLDHPGDDPGHIGLHNIHRRLRLLWGTPYGLAIDARPAHWTSVTLTLPAAPKGGERP